MIKIGDTLPNTTLKLMGINGPESFEVNTELTNKKAVIFAVPGAFTPTCSAAHLPGFVMLYDDIKAAGVDLIACVSVNDAFVMDAWGKSANADNLLMLADGNATFTKAIGLDKDASAYHMGTRSSRYAMIIENGVVKHLSIDEAGLKETSAEAILSKLK
jgi:peroxiredoxin